MSISIIETLIILAGIVFGFINPNKRERPRLFKEGLISGAILGIILGIIQDISLNYLYLGFIGMMGVNVFMPHLVATIVLKKYAPGLLTGLFLNLPFSLTIINWHIKNGINVFYLAVVTIIVIVLVLSSLKYLFRIGKKIIVY